MKNSMETNIENYSDKKKIVSNILDYFKNKTNCSIENKDINILTIIEKLINTVNSLTIQLDSADVAINNLTNDLSKSREERNKAKNDLSILQTLLNVDY